MGEAFFNKKNQKRGLVFGGGGARGAFEIGVWKALDELVYKPTVVAGTSVGALNAVLYAMGDVQEAENMWKEIETDNVLDYTIPLEIESFNDYRKTLTGFLIKVIRDKGISSDPLKNMIDKYIDDEEKLRESNLSIGLSTTNLKTREIEYLYLSDIEKGRLNDYLLASASLYPAMPKTIIDQTPYIDGGYANNIPISMVLDKKLDQLIIVDIKGPGIVKYDKRLKDHDHLWIRTKWPLGDMLLFDKKRAEINIRLGYDETIKLACPEQYGGLWYTFLQKEVMEENNRLLVAVDSFLRGKRTSQLYHYIKEERKQLSLLKEMSKRWEQNVEADTLSLALMELTGKLLNILPEKRYLIEDFQNEIVYRVERLLEKERKQPIKEFQPAFILSGREWSEEFIERLPLLSNRKLVAQILERLEDPTINWDNPLYHLLIKAKPYPFIIALYCKYLREMDN
ncbi:hypothetical protein GCM10008932_01480 [Alkalibacterium iburiense]|uniref:PNPLA domain-containing protein n=1 Tax=Alkalibacterium iburiense TaxID=290589 RepID=A0ABN0X0R1_9LACT